MAILIVDDDKFIALAIAAIIESEDYRCELAYSAEEAILLAEDYETFIIDLLLPGGMDGITLAEEIRKRNEGAEIIFVTGNIDTYNQKLMAAISPLMITKPLTDESIYDLREMFQGAA